jgi:hypothetical protein
MYCPVCGFRAHEDYWWFPKMRIQGVHHEEQEITINIKQEGHEG